jgi:hypothetical protein
MIFLNALSVAFDHYHTANPAIYDHFKRFTFELIGAGRKYISADMVMHRVRFESEVRGTGQFKCNNNFVAAYARLFMLEYPEHDGIFRTRKSKEDLMCN